MPLLAVPVFRLPGNKTDNGAKQGKGRKRRRGARMAYNIGEKPGKGKYCCTNCSWSVNLNDTDDTLPPCGNCGKGQNTTYEKC